VVFSRVPYYFVLNDAGQTAFSGQLTGPGVDISNKSGIWSEGSGSLSLIARMGDAAPGTDPGVVFSRMGDPGFNDASQIIFKGHLTGPGVDDTDNWGLWSERDGSLSLITRAGNAVPGMDPDVVIHPFDDHTLFNNAGQAAFDAYITGPGVDSTNEYGIFATDRDGILRLIVQTGDLFDVNDDPLIDEFHTISTTYLTYAEGVSLPHAEPLNDAGQLAFKLDFTDGSSGFFVATIPEPATLALFAFGGITLLRRRAARIG
jgi:hypothetical protein